MNENLEEYEKLMEKVLARFPDLSREEVEALVESKLRESNLLNRVGALLLVAEELGAFRESAESSPDLAGAKAYTRIGDLVPGLNDISVRGVVYAVGRPVKVRDHTIMVLKIGDRTGTASVILWDERAEEASKLGLRPGAIVAILHAYTRERLETGKAEIHLGRGGSLMKLEPEPGAPKPESFFMGLDEAVESGRGIYDIRAMVLEVGDERVVSTRYGEASLREVLLIGDEVEARLTLWRERAEELKDLAPGEVIYLTDVRVAENRLALTRRSIVAIREKPSPETLRRIAGRKVKNVVLRVLDVVETKTGLVIISTNGSEIIRVVVSGRPRIKSGDHIMVKEAVQEVRGGRMRLLCGEGDVMRITPGEEIEAPKRMIRLSEIVSGKVTDERDVIVEGILYTRTNLTSVQTRFGEAKKIGFWLKEGDAAVQGIAWRSKAEELSEVPEGSRIRLKWVGIRLNIFNEPEINLGSDSIIEVLSVPQEKLR